METFLERSRGVSTHNKGRRSLTGRYLAALLAPAVVAGVMQLTWPFFAPNPVSLFFLAVMFSAWYGGLGPGLLSVLISGLLANYFFIAPYFSLRLSGHFDLVDLVIMVTVGSLISVLSESMHRQSRRAGINLDISERAQESLSRLAAIVESSDDAIIGKTLAGIITSWNKGAEHIYGYTEAEVIGRSISILVPRILPDELPMILEKIRRGEPVEPYETERLRKDGRIISVSLTVSPIKNADGIVIGTSAIARDITERKRAEEALREAERKYRDIFENAEEGIFQTSPEGRTITANPALARMLGFDSPEELIRERTDIAQQEYVDPPRREEFKRLLNEHDAVRGFEYEALRKDGSRIWMRESVRAVRDENGKLLCYEGITEDITERKQVEKALGEKTVELDRYFTSSLDLLCIADTDGYFHRLNPEWEKTLGYPLAELKGKRFLDFVHPQDLDATLAAISQLNSQEEVLNFVNRYRCSDNSYRWIEWRSFPHGRLIYAVARDITERKLAEHALREAEWKYRDIFENAGEGIFQTTPEGKLITANPALARMVGFDSLEEFIRSLTDISLEIYADPERREEFKRLLEEHGMVRGFEHQAFRKDGSKIWITVNARVVRDQQGEVLYYEGTAQDITERKRAEARSAAFANVAQKLSGARSPLDAGQIIAQTAHDLFGWDSYAFDLYDAKHDVIHPVLTVDTIGGKQVDVTPFFSGQKPTPRGRRVIDHGPELILRKEPVQFGEDDVCLGALSRPSAAMMTAPIRHASQVIGILSIQSHTPLEYDDEAMRDLLALADHCGEALNRIRAEQSLHESEERFRQMAENFEDVIWMTDRDISKILYINPAYERIFGRSCKSVYERLASFLDAVHPGDRESVERRLERQGNGDHLPSEYRIVRPDGSVRWLQRRSFPIRNNEGEIYRIAGIDVDITERKRAEEALRQSEVYFRSLVEHAADTISTYDANGVRLYTSPSIERVLGYKPEEMIGRSGFELLHPDDRPLLSSLFAQEVQIPGAKITRELRCRHKDGTWRTLESTGSNLLGNPAVGAVVLNSRDITERKLDEEQLRATTNQLRALSERLRSATEQEGARIAREIHDELGSAMTTLHWDLESLDKAFSNSPGNTQSDELRAKIKTMIGLSDNTLHTIRRISSELRPQILDDLGLEEAADWQAKEFQTRTGIICHCEWRLKNLKLNQAQTTAVFRILQEALTNVLRHAQATRVDIKARKELGLFVMTISDDGRGITEAQKSAHESLGLLGMRERAELIGGTFEITGVEGSGTIVTVRVLPVVSKIQFVSV